MSRTSGTVTFLFSDIEGSTARWERDTAAMSRALRRHDELMREAIEAHNGVVFKVVGDAFYAAFERAPDALAAAVRAQRALATADFSRVNGLRVRMALHTGHAERRADDYFGPSVNRVARLLAIGHGGQVLVSDAAAERLREVLPALHELRDLGLHGLKDLARAERVFQVVAPQLDDVFPALRSLDRLPNNLPEQISTFVGRENAIAEIESLLHRGPLVTLAGPAGVGKTRCALQAGTNALQSFGDGVWLVDLAPIADASLVAGTIAQTLGVRQSPNRPIVESLVEHLASRRVLLIFDNCEQVIDEARTVSVEILRRSPGVRVLATSREPLGVGGEHVLRLPSLAVSESIALFTDRARTADSRFTLDEQNEQAVHAIVTRLDGMPLAIELAAARVRVLSPAQIAGRLDERFRMLTGGDRSALPRRQTLRAAIDWSYDLLDERERTLFRRLAIFTGSFDVTAAAEVCSVPGEIDEWEVLDALTALVDKSLILAEPYGDEQRYRLLQSMREYALERLRHANEEETLAERHVQFYARWAQGLAPLVAELEDDAWKQRAGVELDNVRAAIDWSLFDRHDPAVAIALLAHIEWPEMLTAPQEALRWYERAAQESDAMPDEIAHARILRHCVLLQWVTGRPVGDRQASAELELSVARRSGDPDEIARALANLGACYYHGGHFDDAEAVFAQAYANPKQLSRLTRNAVLRIVGVAELQRGRVELARERFLEVVRSERPGSESHASALLNLGELEYAAGSVEAARDAARRARESYASLGSPYLVLVVANLAAYALAAGDLDDARERLREALAMGRSSRWMVSILEHHALYAALQKDWKRAALLTGFTDARYRVRGETRQSTEKLGYERLAALLDEAFENGEIEPLMRAGAELSEE